MIAKKVIRSLAFILLGIILFLIVQHVLTYKWYYPVDGNDPKYTFKEFYDIASDSNIQVLFLGSSHVYCGIDPMTIYQNSGISAYDLTTSAQPIEASCIVLEDALKRTKPECVFLDASLFFKVVKDSPWYRRVIDNMAFGVAKIRFAASFAERFGGDHKLEVFIGAFFPIYQYHNKWSKLTETDFTFNEKYNSYKKGYYHTSVTIQPALLDVEAMNSIDEQIKLKTNQVQTLEVSGKTEESSDKRPIEVDTIKTVNLEYLLEMKNMCDQAGVELRLFKVPSLYSPQYYDSAWTRSKSEAIKEISDKYEIPFLDLMYDVDLSLDWSTDTIDGGKHLNTRGAKKVSSFMTSYLQDVCGLKGKANKHYEADLPIYTDVERFVKIIGIQNMAPYLERLSKLEDICVFFSAYGDMRSMLRPEDMVALKAFGLKTDFEKMEIGSAYLAAVDDGILIYEASSEDQLEKKDEMENGPSYQLRSCGQKSGKSPKIKLDGKEYCLKKRGLNIVVYEKKSQTVVDSLCFDTTVEGEQLAMRSRPGRHLRNYSNWRAYEDYKQGIR